MTNLSGPPFEPYPSPEEETAPEAPNRLSRWSASLGIGSLVTLLLFVGLLLFTKLPNLAAANPVHTGFRAAELVSAVIGGIFVALVVSLIAFFLSGCRPRRSSSC